MTNYNITTEQIEYLLAAGFSMSEIVNQILLIRGDERLVIQGNSISLWVWWDEEQGQTSAKWSLIYSFTGLNEIDVFQFKSLIEDVFKIYINPVKESHSHLIKPEILS